MLVSTQNHKNSSNPKVSRKSSAAPDVKQVCFSIAFDEKIKKLSQNTGFLFFNLLKNELRRRVESNGDLTPFKTLPKELKEMLITAIEDEEDIADIKEVLANIKKGKGK